MKYNFCILKNEDEDSHIEWEKACIKFKVSYDIVELTSDNWFEQITGKDYDCFLLRPPGRLSVYKQMYDERIYIIGKVLGKRLYPSYEEVILHENKKMMAYWLKAIDLPHIETHIFYKRFEAYKYLNNLSFPIVAKTSIGSSGEGVVFLKDVNEATEYIRKAFSTGIGRVIGPGLRQKKYVRRGVKWLLNPKYAIKKLKGYSDSSKSIQKNFVIFQEFRPHKREIRIVKIGHSYFAYHKNMVNGLCSGTKDTEYFNPSLELLEFAKMVFDKGNFQCMSMDILDNDDGVYLINELQTIFGHIRDHLLEVDGKKGRYIFEDNKWIFEEGTFNENLTFNLRLENAIVLAGI